MEWNWRAWPSGRAILHPRAVLSLWNADFPMGVRSSSGSRTVVKQALSWSSSFHPLDDVLSWIPRCGGVGVEKFRPNATERRSEARDRWAKPCLSRVNRFSR